MKNNNKPTILAVMAHPDDETFGIGGTLALYTRKGVSVHVLCATRGEAGDVDEKYMQGFNSIADRRVCELRCATNVLGIEALHLLNYRDSGMNGSPDNGHPNALKLAPIDKVADDIVRKIREIKPQVVITFDPIGGYCHPDHVAVYKATKKAFYLSGNEEYKTDGYASFSPQKLYLNTFSKKSMRFLIRLLSIFGKDPHQYGKNKDIDLIPIAKIEYPIHAVIDYRSVEKIRDQASACYESQGGAGINRSIFGLVRRIVGIKETYMQAFPEPSNDKRIKDLFDGVTL